MGCAERIGTDLRPTRQAIQDHKNRDVVLHTRILAKTNNLEMFGRLDRSGWLELFALERLSQRGGPKVVGEFSLPKGHNISLAIGKGKITLTAHEKMEFGCTMDQISAARKELFKGQPSWMEHAFKTARPKMPQVQEDAAVEFRKVLENEYSRLATSNSQGRVNKELLLRQYALEELLEKKPGVECTQAIGKTFLVALAIQVKHEFSEEEIAQRAKEIEMTL